MLAWYMSKWPAERIAWEIVEALEEVGERIVVHSGGEAYQAFFGDAGVSVRIVCRCPSIIRFECGYD